MTDLTIDQIADQCRAYWLASGVPANATDEMVAELRAHLGEAAAAGKSIDAVTGPNIKSFAAEWAEAFNGSASTTTVTPPSLPRDSDARPRSGLWWGLGGIVVLVGAVAALAPKEATGDEGIWIAIWLIAAALLAVGEMLTAGFFLLPFAAGAVSAGVLALLSVNVPIQITTFVLVSVLALWLMQRFAKMDKEGQLISVGAARYIGAAAIVTESVSRLESGRVNMGMEDWMATTDGIRSIPVGAEVRVIEVRGTRLVVEIVK